MQNEQSTTLPIWAWVLLASVLFLQALWIYLDAAKRNENKFIWGFLGLFNFPSSLLVYLLVTRLVIKTTLCTKCGKRIMKEAKYCPECGEMIEREKKA
jgi:hypothetical protein